MAAHTINVLSLCAGAGGIELGLRLALGNAARTVCYVERESYAAACLVARMADAALDEAPVWDDLASFDGKPWRGVVDCVTAGYPCQPYSVAGKRRGHADKRDLWPYVARIIAESGPSLVFLENVPAILAAWDRERTELRGMGYEVEAGLFTAAEVGAPHRRERFFALAYRNGVFTSANSRKSNAGPNWRDNIVGNSRKPEVGDAPHREHRREQTTAATRPQSFCCFTSTDVGNTKGKRLQGGRGGELQCAHEGLPFPPGPKDTDAWGRILAARPELAPAVANPVPLRFDARGTEQPLQGAGEHGCAAETEAEPAVCRVGDGMAYRVDRLRLCGNGVVPLVAGYAFCTLFARLCGDVNG